MVVACWLIGFFGLAGGRFSLIQIALAGLGFAAWVVVGARRRRIEQARERWMVSGLRVPPPAADGRRTGDGRA